MTKIEIEYFITYAPRGAGGPVCRCSIGHLTDKELDYFVENSNVHTYHDLVLEGKYRIALNTDKEESVHFMALKQFEEDYEKFRINLAELYANGKWGSLEQWPDELNDLGYAHDMRCFQAVAEDVRVKFRPKDVSQPVVNDTTPISPPTASTTSRLKSKKKSRVQDPSKYKYEKPIQDYIDKYKEMQRTVSHDTLSPPTPKNLISYIKTLEGFEDSSENAIRQGIKNSEALRKYRKDKESKEKHIYGDPPPKVDEIIDEWIDPKTEELDGFSKMDDNIEEYENPVQEFFDKLNSDALLKEITREEYCSTVSNTAALLETVAKHLKKQKPFENRSIETIKSGVFDCVAWKNADFLDKDAFDY